MCALVCVREFIEQWRCNRQEGVFTWLFCVCVCLLCLRCLSRGRGGPLIQTTPDSVGEAGTDRPGLELLHLLKETPERASRGVRFHLSHPK